MYLFSEFTPVEDCVVFAYEVCADNRIRLCYSNPLNCENMHIDAQQSLGLTLEELYPPEVARRLLELMSHCVEENCVCQYMRATMVDGRLQYWNITITPISHSQTTWIYGIGRLAQGAFNHIYSLQELDVFLTSLYSVSTNAVVLLAGNTPKTLRVCSCNAVFGYLLNLPSEQLIGRGLAEIFKETTVNTIYEECQSSFEKGCNPSFPLSISVPGGEVNTLMSCTPMMIQGELYALCIIQNFTNSLVTEQEDGQQIVCDCLFDNTVNGLCLMDVKQPAKPVIQRANSPFLLFWNQYTAQLGDFSQAEVYQKACLLRQPVSEQVRLANADGTVMFFHLNINPILRGDCVVKLLIASTDTTEKMKLSMRMNVKLTARESQILEMVANGDKNKFIAYRLDISEGTVKKIISNAYKKLHISSRSELIKFYLSDQHVRFETE